jgi:hypothetical protein
MGIGIPWAGAGLGAAAGIGLDAYRNGFRNWRRSLRKGLTGAATGVGAQLGLQLGGELARRHAVAGGGPLATGVTPVIGALGGAASGYLLGKEHGDDEEENP